MEYQETEPQTPRLQAAAEATVKFMHLVASVHLNSKH